MTPEARETKAKNYWDYTKVKTFDSKRNYQQNEKQLTEGEEIFANDTSHKGGLRSKIYKEFTQLNTKTKQNKIIIIIN